MAYSKPKILAQSSASQGVFAAGCPTFKYPQTCTCELKRM